MSTAIPAFAVDLPRCRSVWASACSALSEEEAEATESGSTVIARDPVRVKEGGVEWSGERWSKT
ncbi:MAG: hypothetical protein P4L40_02715 [Terracidiphilus sp.]|nr:hypothetical protein [Terracidiphilus sp.]